MTFEEAIKKAIQTYMEDDFDDEAMESSKMQKDRKYTKHYLDKFHNDIMAGKKK